MKHSLKIVLILVSLGGSLSLAAAASTARTIALASTASYAATIGIHKTRQVVTRGSVAYQQLCRALETGNTTGETKTLFAHGLGADNTHGQAYKTSGFIPTAIQTFDFQDSPALPAQQRKPSCLGQWDDMDALHKEYVALVKNNNRVNFYGVSRGAATIASMFGGFLNSGPAQAVNTIILESPFDDVKSVIGNILGKASLIPGSTTVGEIATSFIHSRYSPHNIAPIDNIKFLAKEQGHIPILIVCSLEDRLIPASSSIRLYKALQDAGHTKVHLLVTKHGAHANIIGSASGKQYLCDVHAFYRHYGQAHDPKLANQSTHPDFISSRPATGIRARL